MRTIVGPGGRTPARFVLFAGARGPLTFLLPALATGVFALGFASAAPRHGRDLRPSAPPPREATGPQSDSTGSAGAPARVEVSRLIRAIARPGLTSEETRSLLRYLELEWPLTPDSVGHMRNCDAVVGIVTPTGGFTLLVGAKRGEWGMYGPARYALIDSAPIQDGTGGRTDGRTDGRTGGLLLWTREAGDTLLALPAVSPSGMAALLSGVRWNHDRPALRVDFITIDGDVAGSTLWGSLVTRPMQRNSLQEVYGFSPTGDFLITLNQSERDTFEVNRTVLYAVDPDGTIRWRQELGAFAPNELAFTTDGERIVTDDLRAAGVDYDNQVYILNSGGREVAHHVITGARGADGTCLDPETGRFYLDDDGLCAIDLETGRMERAVSPEPLRRLAESGSPSVRNAAARLLAGMQR
jgi:hypothetical protein